MKKSGVVVIIILLLLIIVALSIFIWFTVINKDKRVGVKGDLTSALLSGQDNNWQDFNSDLGYSIKYPANYFKPRNTDPNTDLFEHPVGSENLVGGLVFIKRQATNIKDISKIYSIIEKNLTKDDASLIATKLTNRKSTNLEDGTQIIEYDQTGIEDSHNVILINSNYFFQIGYKTSNADSVMVDYFNKMYPTIKFTQTGVDKIGWDDHISDKLAIKFKTPKGWVNQESETGTLSIVSPDSDILTISNQNRSLGISGTGKHFLVPFNGKSTDITLAVGSDDIPVAGATGSGSSEGGLFFNLKFGSDNAEIRNTDWQTLQEIIKTITNN